jgi:hypothetical protein
MYTEPANPPIRWGPTGYALRTPPNVRPSGSVIWMSDTVIAYPPLPRHAPITQVMTRSSAFLDRALHP